MFEFSEEFELWYEQQISAKSAEEEAEGVCSRCGGRGCDVCLGIPQYFFEVKL